MDLEQGALGDLLVQDSKDQQFQIAGGKETRDLALVEYYVWK